MTRRPVVLLPYIDQPTFYRRDRAMLADLGTVREVPCRTAAETLAAVRLAARADVVFCWFGSLRFLPLVLAARARGRPVVVVAGGYDVARDAELGYGNMLRFPSRAAGRLLFRAASVVLPFSQWAAGETRDHAHVPGHKIRVVPLGFPVPAAAAVPREDMILTVGFINSVTLRRKGLLTIARASRLLPGIRVVFAGQYTPAARDALAAAAGPDAEFPGYVAPAVLDTLYARARVYAQPSLHEGFGAAVAEAMLHGCVPIVTARGSLPEVVGPSGLTVPPDDPDALAAAFDRVRSGGFVPPEAPAARIARCFSLEARRDALAAVLADLVPAASGGAPATEAPGREQHEQGRRHV